MLSKRLTGFKDILNQLVLCSLLACFAMFRETAAYADPLNQQGTASQDLPAVNEIFYASIETWEEFLNFADELEEVVWKNSKFTPTETWEIWLQNAVVARNTSLEALAQRKLLALGASEARIRALYRLDNRSLTEADIARLRFSQRAGVMPVRINAPDIEDLRPHFDEREIVDIMLLNSYGALFNVLYGTGYVDEAKLNPTLAITGLTPQLKALTQKKQETSSGFYKRQFFESPILSPRLSMPYLGMDWLIFNEHAFDVATTWDHFMVGQTSSDCKHCQTHAALGMLYHGRTHERIQQTYLFNDPSRFNDRENASFTFIKEALRLPSQVTDETIANLEANFTATEIDHLLGIAAVTAFLSNYMQISAVVTDAESKNFAEEVLSPVGWHLGRHAGWPEEQRAMHPTTLFRLSEGEDALAMNAMFYRNALRPVLISYYGGKIIGPLGLIIFEVIMAWILLRGVAKNKSVYRPIKKALTKTLREQRVISEPELVGNSTRQA